MPKKLLPPPVTWIGDLIDNVKNGSNIFYYYEKFKFKNLEASVGDFILISNADAAEPDSEEGCDAAKILSVYENKEKKSDPFRAKVQWYTKPNDLPSGCLNDVEDVKFVENEVIEDNRPFDTDVSIETFFKKCNIIFSFSNQMPMDSSNKVPFTYICRYRLTALSKRKFNIEPVLEEEREALRILGTPKKVPQTPKTPNSLAKRMSRISISEHNWSVSKTDGTKMLLKKAILTDKIEKSSPKKIQTSKSVKLTSRNLEEIVSMELEHNSDEEMPTLIIKQSTPSTPKRRSQKPAKLEETPKRTLHFEEALHQTRSGRSIKNPVYYAEDDTSPVKRTPRSVRKRIMSDDSGDEFKVVAPTPKTPKTPKTPRTPKSSRGTPVKTPRSVSRRILTSQLTPSLRDRAHSVEQVNDYAKQNQSLPGRENQMDEILSFVRTRLLDGTSGCMYISGVPGTGKTATVCSALRRLQAAPGLPAFQLVEVNGMRIAEPRQAYVQVYRQLTGKSVAWEQACALLDKRFTSHSPRREPTVLLVDELDALCTRRQDVLYSIAEWAAHATARLTVLAVANTMDLPERALASRVASRLGLTRLSFAPYAHAELAAIVAARLGAGRVSPDAVQLIARKVAAVSGDARRALALCGRALELAGPAGAGLAEVQRALAEAASSAPVRAIKRCSAAERLVLRAVAAEVERTGTDETTLSRVLTTAAAIVALDGRPYRAASSVRAPSPSQARALCGRLAAARLLLLDARTAEPRLLLNVSADDVHYATREIGVY